jgi:hypothetical protein
VRVNAVAPGWIASSGLDHYEGTMAKALIPRLRAGVPLGRLGTESECSAAITFLLSEAAAFISGTTLRVDGAAPNASLIWPSQEHDRVPAFNGFHRASSPKSCADRHARPRLQSRHHRRHLQGQPRRPARARRRVPRHRAARPRQLGRQAEKFAKRGQLLPRDRVARLLDRGAPFLELSTLAGYQMHDDDGRSDAAGGGNISGIGFVSGVRCMVGASDSAIKGGAIAPMGLQEEPARPGDRPPAEAPRDHPGRERRRQPPLPVRDLRRGRPRVRQHGPPVRRRHPQITVVHGSSTAGGAYLPGLSDYVIAVRGHAKVFLAGPPLVKAAIGEDADDEALGGAELHATVTGTAEYIAENDAHALHLARQIMTNLAARDRPFNAPVGPRPHRPPRYDIDELLGIVPPDFKKPYDAREVIARLVDDSDFLEFKPSTGRAPCAATPRSRATPSASSPTTARSPPTARPRPATSSSCAASPAPRSSTCRTPPATWSAPRPSAPAWSSTAPR